MIDKQLNRTHGPLNLEVTQRKDGRLIILVGHGQVEELRSFLSTHKIITEPELTGSDVTEVVLESGTDREAVQSILDSVK